MTKVRAIMVLAGRNKIHLNQFVSIWYKGNPENTDGMWVITDCNPEKINGYKCKDRGFWNFDDFIKEVEKIKPLYEIQETDWEKL